MTYAVYCFKPLSLRALGAILWHMAYGQTARYERFMASMILPIASGRKVDLDKTEPFGRQVEAVWHNPFQRRDGGPRTRKEIEAYILKRLTE